MSGAPRAGGGTDELPNPEDPERTGGESAYPAGKALSQAEQKLSKQLQVHALQCYVCMMSCRWPPYDCSFYGVDNLTSQYGQQSASSMNCILVRSLRAKAYLQPRLFV